MFLECQCAGKGAERGYMEYREMKKLGVSPSLLGFGCMRFPTDSTGKIDRVKAEVMLDKALEQGVTYFDTAYGYHDGESEKFLGDYLASRKCRDKIFLATKLPLWLVHSCEDAERLFAEQLERLQTDHFDFYLMHAVNGGKFDEVEQAGVIKLLEKYKEEGKIRFLGFSFHDSYEVFERVLRYRDWDFCQIQFNYMDTDSQAGMKGYRLAEELGVPLVIMEPAKGGSLTTFTDDIVDIFKKVDPVNSVASWAFRWVASLPNVKVVLSGMTTLEQVEDNLKTFSQFKPLNQLEQDTIDRVVKEVNNHIFNGCTGCRYCMPCPAGVFIPHCFRIWNDYAMYHNAGHAVFGYFQQTGKEHRADQCIECGACEAACPQGLSIREDLKRVTRDMEALRKQS